MPQSSLPTDMLRMLLTAGAPRWQSNFGPRCCSMAASAVPQPERRVVKGIVFGEIEEALSPMVAPQLPPPPAVPLSVRLGHL